MFNVLSSINWLSVTVAFMVYFLLGALWYMRLFPRLYKVSLGKANEALQNQGPLYIAGPGLCVLVTVVASAVLFYALLALASWYQIPPISPSTRIFPAPCCTVLLPALITW